MKKFCNDLWEHSTKIINYEKIEMRPLTYEENRSYEMQKVCYIYKKEFSTADNNKNYHNIRDHCHYIGEYKGVAHDVPSVRYKKPKKTPVVFHNGSTYDYHSIIKGLSK